MSKKQEEINVISIEEFEQVKAELETLQTSSIQMEAQLKRAVADYRNLETRVKEGRSELTAWGTIDLITRFLVVLDYLEQATNGASDIEKQSGWFKGVEMAVKQFREVLKGEGLEEIIVTDRFDPKLHEAVDTQDGENDVILKIVRKGYNLQGKVIRPVQVVVGRKLESRIEDKEVVEEEDKNE